MAGGLIGVLLGALEVPWQFALALLLVFGGIWLFDRRHSSAEVAAVT